MGRSRYQLVASCAGVLLLTSCIVEAPGSDKERGQRPETTSTSGATGARPTAPAAQPAVVKSGANFEDKVELLGATLLPSQLIPGEQMRITAYFKVLAAIPADYMIFVHVEDPDAKAERMNVDHKPMGGQYPTSQWKVGETLRDEFPLYLPPGSQQRAVNLWIGFWDPKTDARLKVKNPDQVKTDGKDRVLMVQVPVTQP